LPPPVGKRETKPLQKVEIKREEVEEEVGIDKK
jgi:hypothetical protein